MAEITIDDIQKTVKDSVYVTIGLGVIAFQKAQVQRQELRKQFEANAKQLQASTDAVLDDIEQRLPTQVRTVMHQARETAKDARTQLRGLV